MFKELHHIGIVVKNLDEAIELYSDIFHLAPSERGEIRTLKANQVRVTLLPVAGTFIELLEPMGTEDRFARHLRERGEGLFHLCIFTEDYDAEIRSLKEKGYKLEEVVNTELFAGSMFKLAWLSPEETTGIWIELVDLAGLPPSHEEGR